MKFWILLLFAGLLLLWGAYRERFEPTSSIKAPPSNDTEKARIYGMLSVTTANALMAKARADLPNETDAFKLAVKAAGYVTPAMTSFYTTVYQPGTTTITAATVDTFMQNRTGNLKPYESEAITVYFVNQASIASSGYLDILAGLGQSPGYTTPGTTAAAASTADTTGTTGTTDVTGAASGTTAATAAPTTPDVFPATCPDGMTLSAGLCRAPTRQPTCPSGYEFRNKKCRPVGNTTGGPIDPTCETGFAYHTPSGMCRTSPNRPNVRPTCPSGYVRGADNMCRRPAAIPPATGTTPPTSETTGTTTGGGSVSSYGPTSGGYADLGPADRRKQVFGPLFGGGGGGGSVPADTSQTNRYPQLLGGLGDASTQIPGAGIVPPSQNWNLVNNGSLPPPCSLGAGEMSGYLPYSRCPGDMDLIPDPYRVSQASLFSPKTEPVPFLTDFSAFFR